MSDEMVVRLELGRSDSLIRTITDTVDENLVTLVSETDPPELYDPVRYVLSSGGKRLRPALLILSARTFGASLESALPAALAVELFHNFTLVHDDIMDSAAERRGRPTVHVRWDDGTAILAGDYLLSLSYRLLADCDAAILPSLLEAYHVMVQRLCEGQILDAVFEGRDAVSTQEYLRMIDSKTGALLEACLTMGGIIGRADAEELTALEGIGRNLGRAFQIKDDLLDLTADDERWGKKRGGDLMRAKKTFLLVKALESPDGHVSEWFGNVVRHGGIEESRIEEARERLRSSGIIGEAASAVEQYSDQARSALAGLPKNEFAEALARLVERLRLRLH